MHLRVRNITADLSAAGCECGMVTDPHSPIWLWADSSIFQEYDRRLCCDSDLPAISLPAVESLTEGGKLRDIQSCMQGVVGTRTPGQLNRPRLLCNHRTPHYSEVDIFDTDPQPRCTNSGLLKVNSTIFRHNYVCQINYSSHAEFKKVKKQGL